MLICNFDWEMVRIESREQKAESRIEVMNNWEYDQLLLRGSLRTQRYKRM